MRIDQFVPAFHRGDAIGDTASHLKEFFSSQEYSSEIYCLTRDEGLEKDSRLFSEFEESGPSDITILHFALPSPLTQAFSRTAGKKVLLYHNLTPPEFFEGFSPEMPRIVQQGREELRSLIPCANLALADSEYNRQELVQEGFKRIEVFPLFVDFKKYEKPMNRFVYDLFKDGRINILFIGRIAPNKKIEDLIKVAFYYKKYISPLVRLIIVGKTDSFPRYYHSLVRLADEFFLQPEEICFTGHVSDEEMFAYYRASDLFLSLSEHEGFGLPFIESMVFNLPVVAYDCTAVASTLGGSGVLVKDKTVELVGELIRIVAEDKKLREWIIREQQKRLRDFQRLGREALLQSMIEELREDR
jgi:glycosyltransferase involved in cell wall biosynthesis